MHGVPVKPLHFDALIIVHNNRTVKEGRGRGVGGDELRD